MLQLDGAHLLRDERDNDGLIRVFHTFPLPEFGHRKLALATKLGDKGCLRSFQECGACPNLVERFFVPRLLLQVLD